MPVIGGAFSCGFGPADSLIGIILGLAQRNRGRKTSHLDVTPASGASAEAKKVLRSCLVGPSG
jgi:hypothetical protein